MTIDCGIIEIIDITIENIVWRIIFLGSNQSSVNYIIYINHKEAIIFEMNTATLYVNNHELSVILNHRRHTHWKGVWVNNRNNFDYIVGWLLTNISCCSHAVVTCSSVKSRHRLPSWREPRNMEVMHFVLVENSCYYCNLILLIINCCFYFVFCMSNFVIQIYYIIYVFQYLFVIQ